MTEQIKNILIDLNISLDATVFEVEETETKTQIVKTKEILESQLLYEQHNAEFITSHITSPLNTLFQVDTGDKNKTTEALCDMYGEIFAKINKLEKKFKSDKNSTESTIWQNQITTLLKLINHIVSIKTDFGLFCNNILTCYCSSVNVDETIVTKLWNIMNITLDDRMYHVKRLLSKDTGAIGKYRKIYKRLCTGTSKYDLLEESHGWSEILTLVLAGMFDDHIIYSKNPMAKFDKFYIPKFEDLVNKYHLDQTLVVSYILDVMIASLGPPNLNLSKYRSKFYSHNSWRFCFLLLEYMTFNWYSVQLANIDELDFKGGNMIISTLLNEKINNQIDTSRGDDISGMVSNSFQVACILLKAGLISFQSIYSGLQPQDDSIIIKYFDLYMSELKEIKTEASSTSNVLATAQALTNEDDNGKKLISTTAATFGLKISESKTNLTNHPSEKVDANIAEFEKKNEKKDITNQVRNCSKLLFLEKLLEMGCYTPAVYLLKKYKHAQFQNPVLMSLSFRMFNNMIANINPHITNVEFDSNNTSLSRVVTGSVLNLQYAQQKLLYISKDPLDVKIPPYEYEYYYPEWTKQLPNISTIQDLFKYSHEALILFLPRLDYDGGETLVQNIVNIALHDLSENPSNSKEWFNYVRKFLFPSMVFNSISINNQIYEIMKKFSVDERFILYNELSERLIDSNIHIKIMYAKSEKVMKNLLKVVSYDKESSQCRKFANYANSNPLAVFDFVLTTIENFDKVSSILVTASKFLNAYALDVLEYSLLKRLTKNRETISADGINMVQWFQNLSNFISNMVKAQPKFKCPLIIEYILRNLMHEDYSAAHLLKNMLDSITGIQPLNDVQEEALLMLNSGNYLNKIARFNLLDKREENYQLSRSFLENFSVCSNDSISLFILYLSQYLRTVLQTDIDEKIISNRYDDVSSTLWRLVEFSKYYLSATEFSNIIFSFSNLIDKYDVNISWAFHLWRDNLLQANTIHDNRVLVKNTQRLCNEYGENVEFFGDFWMGTLKQILYDEKIYSSTSKYEGKFSSETMESDKNEHVKLHEEFMNVIKIQKQSWAKNVSETQAYEFLLKCIIPRGQFGLEDAYYASEFLFSFFNMDEICLILNTLINSNLLATQVASLTSDSVAYFGTFMKRCFQKIVEVEHDSLPRNILTWSFNFTNTMAYFIGSDSYPLSRSCIQLMSKVVFTFPIFKAHISVLINSVETRLLTEKRNDMRTPCETVLGFLKTQHKNCISVINYCNLSESEIKLYSEIENSHQFYENVSDYKKKLAGFQQQDKLLALKKQREEEEALAKKKKQEEEALAIKLADEEALARKEKEALVAKEKAEEEALAKKKAEEQARLAAEQKKAQDLENMKKRKEELEQHRKRLLNQDLPTAPKKLKLEIAANDNTDYVKLAYDVLEVLEKDEFKSDGVAKVVKMLKNFEIYCKLKKCLETPSNNFSQSYTDLVGLTLGSFFRSKIPDEFSKFANKLKFIIESCSKHLTRVDRIKFLTGFKQMEGFMEQYKIVNETISSRQSVGRTKVSESTVRAPVTSRFNNSGVSSANSIPIRSLPASTRSNTAVIPQRGSSVSQRVPVSSQRSSGSSSKTSDTSSRSYLNESDDVHNRNRAAGYSRSSRSGKFNDAKGSTSSNFEGRGTSDRDDNYRNKNNNDGRYGNYYRSGSRRR